MNSDKPKESMQTLIDSIKPMRQDRVPPYREPIKPIPNQRLKDNERVIEEMMNASDLESSFESGDELKYLREGLQPRLLKRLRRGDFAIQDELDLHGLIAAEAKRSTHAFINACALDGITAIRIVHGKGHNSQQKKPVIKNLLLGWLKNNQYVRAVCSAPANDGGTGAVYVLISAK